MNYLIKVPEQEVAGLGFPPGCPAPGTMLQPLGKDGPGARLPAVVVRLSPHPEAALQSRVQQSPERGQPASYPPKRGPGSPASLAFLSAPSPGWSGLAMKAISCRRGPAEGCANSTGLGVLTDEAAARERDHLTGVSVSLPPGPSPEPAARSRPGLPVTRPFSFPAAPPRPTQLLFS